MSNKRDIPQQSKFLADQISKFQTARVANEKTLLKGQIEQVKLLFAMCDSRNIDTPPVPKGVKEMQFIERANVMQNYLLEIVELLSQQDT